MVGHAMAGKDLQSVSYKYDFSKQEACNLQLEINTKTGAQQLLLYIYIAISELI